MNRRMALFVLSAVGAVLFAAAAAREDDGKGQWYKADLKALNNSGVEGTAWFHLKGDQLKVDVKATGLVPNQSHPMHVHGFRDGKASACPPEGADTNRDGVISLDEIQTYVGMPLVDITGANVGEDGTLKFSKTIKVAPRQVEPLDMRSFVIHGMKVRGSYDATTPVACGQLQVSQRKGLEEDIRDIF